MSQRWVCEIKQNSNLRNVDNGFHVHAKYPENGEEHKTEWTVIGEHDLTGVNVTNALTTCM